MAVRVAIIGVDVIGRLSFTLFSYADGYQVVAINDLPRPQMLIRL